MYLTNSVSGSSNPPTPWIDSKITEHTSPLEISFLKFFLSLKFRNVTFISSFNFDLLLWLSVILNAALLLPWKEFLNAIILDFLV